MQLLNCGGRRLCCGRVIAAEFDFDLLSPPVESSEYYFYRCVIETEARVDRFAPRLDAVRSRLFESKPNMPVIDLPPPKHETVLTLPRRKIPNTRASRNLALYFVNRIA